MKLHALKNGPTLMMREPGLEDVERTLRFFQALPVEDRRYLRIHDLNRQRTEFRIRQSLAGDVYRILALDGDDVVADGALEFSTQEWGRHMGEIRVFVSRPYRRKRVGALIIQDLFKHAQLREVEKVVARMAQPQASARKVFERLGFHVDAVLPKFVKDSEGNFHDQIVMSCTLDECWHQLKDFYTNQDWAEG